ncbi:MAG: hypothetical protein ACPGXX_10675, partial [Planctomycetaceae bacterium]
MAATSVQVISFLQSDICILLKVAGVARISVERCVRITPRPAEPESFLSIRQVQPERFSDISSATAVVGRNSSVLRMNPGVPKARAV